jgi:hypothetical protein
LLVVDESSPRLGESTCRLGGFRHDGKVANPKGGSRHVDALCAASRKGRETGEPEGWLVVG